MKLIVGLGNPGKDYENTRHNVGYMVVDSLKKSSKYKAFKSDKFIVLKSTVFMNESGLFVKSLTTRYSLPTTNLYIVHDDLDIKLGEYKIQFGRGPKDHNGIKSVDDALGTSDYWRVRIGIDNRHSETAESVSRGPVRGAKHSLTGGEEYVLQNFSDEERKVLDRVIKEVVSKLDNI